jgi:DNA-binding transcriptional regulator YiaG
MKKYNKSISIFKQLRIDAGFKTAKEAADYTETAYSTWHKWESEETMPMTIIWKYLELLIEHNKQRK